MSQGDQSHVPCINYSNVPANEQNVPVDVVLLGPAGGLLDGGRVVLRRHSPSAAVLLDGVGGAGGSVVADPFARERPHLPHHLQTQFSDYQILLRSS